MALARLPKIAWGASFANTLYLGPIDEPTAYSLPREGSSWIKSGAGDEDAFIFGPDKFLKFIVRYIPTNDATVPYQVTGWDTASTGFKAFLEWAWQKNIFNWYPDKTLGTFQPCYLTDPVDPFGNTSTRAGMDLESVLKLEKSGDRTFTMKIRSSDNSDFTGY